MSVVLTPFYLFSQQGNNYVIYGIVSGQDENPIENVHVFESDTILRAISDNDGFFSFKTSDTSFFVMFSHIGFQKVREFIEINGFDKSIHNSYRIDVQMEERDFILPEVNITGDDIDLAYSNKKVWIIDYAVDSIGIFIIAKDIRNNILLLLDYNQDTLTYKPISKKLNSLTEDAFGNIHLLSTDSAYQIFYNGNSLYLLYGILRKDFDNNLVPIKVATDSILIVQSYSAFNQEIYYTQVKKSNGIINEFKHIVNEDSKKVAVEYYNELSTQVQKSKLGEIDSDILSEIRSQLQNDLKFKYFYTKPIYAPVVFLNNKIYLFAFDENKVYIFNPVGHEYASFRIDFHQNKEFNNYIIIDVSQNKCYAEFIKNGIVTIKEINLNNGTIISNTSFDGYIFPDNLQVYDDFVYFLCRDRYSNYIMQRHLYKIKIK